jgi:acetyltransferase-like isoleucine patch superfamily enzyme
MRLGTFARRFLPGWLVSRHYHRRFGASVDPRAEVDLSPLLSLAPGVRIAPFTKVKAANGRVSVGERTEIGAHCTIAGYVDGIEIGRDCRIGPRVTIIGVNYRYDRIDMGFRAQGLMSKGLTRIGNGVRIGAGAAILDGADIGDGAVIAPRAVVSGRVRAAAETTPGLAARGR